MSFHFLRLSAGSGENGSWLGDKTKENLLNNILEVKKVAVIREKRSFLEAKCRSPGNPDFNLRISSFDLLSQTKQGSEMIHFVSSQVIVLPPSNFHPKQLCCKNVMIASAAFTSFYNGIISVKGNMFLISYYYWVAGR